MEFKSINKKGLFFLLTIEKVSFSELIITKNIKDFCMEKLH